MATYSRHVLVIQRVEFHVPAPEPWGADWVEVSKAIHAAHQELRELGEVAEDAEAAADQIQVEPRDDVIVVSFEQRTTSAVSR